MPEEQKPKVRLTAKEMILRKFPCIKESEIDFVCRTGSNTFNVYLKIDPLTLEDNDA